MFVVPSSWLITDVVSGGKAAQPGLTKYLDYMRGDILVVRF
jgi:hypothetical protein